MTLLFPTICLDIVKKEEKEEFKLDVYIDARWHRQNINYYTLVRL